jgi:hypothetical protein
VGDTERCVHERSLNVAKSLFSVFIENQATELESNKTGGVKTWGGCGCGCGFGGFDGGKRPFFDRTSVDIGANLFVSGCETLATFFIVSWDGMRVCRAYLFGLDVDKNESVFVKFAD